LIKFIVDSTCDLTKEECLSMGLEVLPLTIHFEGETYLDGIDLTPAEFYDKMRHAQTVPTTSQVNPGQFEQAFKPHIDNGDDIVVITLSSKLSATMQSAMIAAKEVSPDRIHLVDSLSASFGEALLIRHAVKLRDSEKYTAKEIADAINKLVPRLRLYAVVDTLKYLKMGGRLSGSAAFIGGVLGITPIIEVIDGRVESVGKVRGEKAGMRALQQYIQESGLDESYGIGVSNADDLAKMDRYIEFLKPSLGSAEIYTGDLGSVIGAHIGPGVVGCAYIAKDK
jgi:DegV family protein with EDD domain